MKKSGSVLFFTALFVLLTLVSAAAETRYVTDRLEVVVRGGRGMEYRILAVVKTDEEVEVLGYEEDYARVKTSRGIEGWMLKRYLSAETPKALVIEEYKRRIDMLKENGSDSEKKLLELDASLKELKKIKKVQKQKIKVLEKEYQELKTGSADFLKLKKEKEKLEGRIEMTGRKLSRVIEENLELKKQTKIKWFIAGGAAILIGFILGLYLQNLRNERRRHLSF